MPRFFLLNWKVFVQRFSKFFSLISDPPKAIVLWQPLFSPCFLLPLKVPLILFSGEFVRDLVALESGGSGGVVWRIQANATKNVCAVESVPFFDPTEQTSLVVLARILQTTLPLPLLSSATSFWIDFPI